MRTAWKGSRWRIRPDYFLPAGLWNILYRAFEEAADGKTEVPLSLIGTALKRMMPKFKIKRYGCKTLGKLYEKLDRYELVRRKKECGSRTVETLNVFYKG